MKNPAMQAIEPKTTQYPIVDGHRRHYIVHPVPVMHRRKKKWVAVSVFNGERGGYSKIDPQNPTIHLFDNEELCQRACDIHNGWHFGLETQKGRDYVNGIIADSMNKSIAWDTMRSKMKVELGDKLMKQFPKWNLHINFDNHTPVLINKSEQTTIDNLNGFRLQHYCLNSEERQTMAKYLKSINYSIFDATEETSTVIIPMPEIKGETPKTVFHHGLLAEHISVNKYSKDIKYGYTLEQYNDIYELSISDNMLVIGRYLYESYEETQDDIMAATTVFCLDLKLLEGNSVQP